MNPSEQGQLEDLRIQIDMLEGEVARYHLQFDEERQRHVSELIQQQRTADAERDKLRLDHATNIESLRVSHHGQLTEIQMEADAALLAARTASSARFDELRRQYELAVAGEGERLEQTIVDAETRAAEQLSAIEEQQRQNEREREQVLAEVTLVRAERDELIGRVAELEVRRDSLEDHVAQLAIQLDTQRDEHQQALTAMTEALAEARAGRADEAAKLQDDLAHAQRSAEQALAGLDERDRVLQRRILAGERRAAAAQAEISRLENIIETQGQAIREKDAELREQQQVATAGLASVRRSAQARIDESHRQLQERIEGERTRAATELALSEQRIEQGLDDVADREAQLVRDRSAVMSQIEAVRTQRDELIEQVHDLETVRGSLDKRIDDLSNALESQLARHEARENDLNGQLTAALAAHEVDVQALQTGLEDAVEGAERQSDDHERTIGRLQSQLAAAEQARQTDQATLERLNASLDERSVAHSKTQAELRNLRRSSAERLRAVRRADEARLDEAHALHQARLDAERARSSDELRLARQRFEDHAAELEATFASDGADRLALQARATALRGQLDAAQDEVAALRKSVAAAERDQQRAKQDATRDKVGVDQRVAQLTERLDDLTVAGERERSHAASLRDELIAENLQLARRVDEVRREAVERVERANSSMADLQRTAGERLRELAWEASEHARAASAREALLEAELDRLRGIRPN